MKTRKIVNIIVVLNVLLALPLTSKAQVKIGEEVAPTKGAILDLKKTGTTVGKYYLGGLLLPNIEIEDLGFIPTSFTDAVDMPGYDLTDGVDTNQGLAGMLVYNTKENKSKNIFVGIYMWHGDNWKAVSEQDAIQLDPVPADFAESGEMKSYEVLDMNCSLNGDYIHMIIAGNAYAQVFPSRSSDGKFDLTFDANPTFVERNAIIAVTNPCGESQYFVFTQKEGINSSLPIIETTSGGWRKNFGKVTLSATASSDADGIRWYETETGGTVIATGTGFSPDIQTWGLKKYYVAAYNQSGESTREEVTAVIGCGAYVENEAGEDDWMVVHCYNLGADETVDPLEPDQYLHGHKYRFGVKTPSMTMTADQATTISDPVTGWNATNTSQFPYQAEAENWRTENNPCPTGWRIPTQEEWNKMDMNSKNSKSRVGNWDTPVGTTDNYTSGLYLGDYLFLPTTGYRGSSNGTLVNRGAWGYYWTSTVASTWNDQLVAYRMYFSKTGMNTVKESSAHFSFGYAVRCVLE